MHRLFRPDLPPHHYRRTVLLWLDNMLSGHAPRLPLPDEMGRILILAQEKFGDAILLVPLLGQLQDTFPHIHVDVLCSRYNKPFFTSLPYIRDAIPYRGEYRLLRHHLSHNIYDVFYNHKDHPSFTANRIAERVDARVKVCLSHPKHNQYYNHILPNRKDAHIVEKNGELLRPFGVAFPLPNRLPIPPSVIEQARLPALPDKHLILSINLSSGGKHRRWPLDNWLLLLERLFETDPTTRILLFAMLTETQDAERLKSTFGENVIYPLTARSLYEAAAFIRQSDMLISPDTALVHVAAATGIPVTGLYTCDERSMRQFAPYGVPHRIVQSDTWTLEGITPDSVFEAALELLNESKSNFPPHRSIG